MRGGVGKGQGVKAAEKVYENKEKFVGGGRGMGGITCSALVKLGSSLLRK